MPLISLQRAIGCSTPTSSADHPLLNPRHTASRPGNEAPERTDADRYWPTEDEMAGDVAGRHIYDYAQNNGSESNP